MSEAKDRPLGEAPIKSPHIPELFSLDAKQKGKLRSISRPSATPELDKNISAYIDYLLSKENQEITSASSLSGAKVNV